MTTSRPAWLYPYDQHHILDASRWRQFKPRQGDIVVSTSMKAGTTWMMTIVANLLFKDGAFPEPIDRMSPWIELRLMPADQVMANLEKQTHRRLIKSHTPLIGMPYFDECRYIVVGRDTRDVFMSLVNHHLTFTDQFHAMLQASDERLGRSFPKTFGDIHEMWRRWMTEGWFDNESDGYPYWSHLTHCQSWWDFKHLPNILFVHFNDLLANITQEVERIAEFLSIGVDASRIQDVAERTTFRRMKQDFADIWPDATMIWKGGAESFMHKGTNDRWREVLSSEELSLYETAATRVLTDDARTWLERGGSVT